MSVKRSAGDLDPDYQDLAEQQAKRQRVIEKDARQASEDAIRRIMTTQFSMEMENKEMEARDADKCLNDARIMMDRLRAVVVASFYSRQQDERGKSTSEDWVPSVHPTAKKHLGKAPVGVEIKEEKSDPPSSLSKLNSDLSLSADKAANAKKNNASNTSTQVKAAVSASSSTSVRPSSSTTGFEPMHEEEQGNSRFSTKRTIVVGNCSRFLLPHQRQPSNPSTHKWMVYVRGPRDKPDISDVVSKVWFFLHPSYRPCDLVEVKEPPFHLSRRGWGEFPVRVQLHFHDSRNKRMDVIHNLVLDKTYTGLQTLGAETVVSVDLVRDPIPLGRARPSALSTHSDQVIMEASIKREPVDTHPGSAEVTEECRCGSRCTHPSQCDEEGENCGIARRQGGEGSELRGATNVAIKEEPLDPCEEEVPSARTVPAEKGSGMTQNELRNDLGIQQGPDSGDQVVVRQQDVEGHGVCSQRGSENEREGSQKYLTCPQQTAGVSLNGVGGELGRTSSVDLNLSLPGVLNDNGQHINTPHSTPSTLSAGKNSTSRSSDDNAQCQMSVQKRVSLLPTASVNSRGPGGQPQKSVGGLTASEVQLSSFLPSQTAFGKMLTGQAHTLKAAPVKIEPDDTSVSRVCTLNDVSSLNAVSLLNAVSSLKAASSQRTASGLSAGPVALLKAASPQTPASGAQMPSSAAGAVKMVVVNSSHLPAAGRGGAVSLLTGNVKRQETSAVATAPVPVAMSLMKVTAQGLKPICATGTTPTASPATHLSAKSSPLLVRHSAQAQASTQGQVSALSVKPSVVRSTTVDRSSSSTQKPGMRSLLRTAAKPGIQALLQKSCPLPSSGVSPASKITGSSLSSPVLQNLSVISASPRSIIPGVNASCVVNQTQSLVSSASRLGPSSSPYVLAQMNNRKVLVKLNAKQPVKEIGVESGQPPCLGSDSRNVLGAETMSLSLTGRAGLSGLVPTADLRTVLPDWVGRVSATPGASQQAVQQTRNTGSHQTSKQDLSGYTSQAGMELAKAKAAFPNQTFLSNCAIKRETLIAQSLTQRATLREQIDSVDLPPPKPRCGRWFHQGLGSDLVPDSRVDQTQPPVESGDARTLGPLVEIVDIPGEGTEWDKEKKIMVVKKKPSSGLNLMVTGKPVSRLSVQQYSSMAALIKAAVLRHPLLSAKTEKTVHPYCATSLKQWTSWHPAKRNACEWSRAVAVRRYLQKYLGEEGGYRGERLWRAKTIMHWCRRSGLSPNGPGGRPLMELAPSSDEVALPCLDKPLLPVSDFDALCCGFKSADSTKICEEEPMEVDVLAVEPCATAVKEEAPLQVGYELNFELLPSTAEAQFVQDTGAQVGVKFSPAVLIPGVFASTAEDMLFGAMMEFASDLLHHACLAATSDLPDSPEGPHVTLASREVLQAMKTLSTTSFLGNQYCGIPNPSAAPTTNTTTIATTTSTSR